MPLKSLVLQAAWSYPQATPWSNFKPTLQQLTQLFPNLHKLDLKVPLLQYRFDIFPPVQAQHLQQRDAGTPGLPGTAVVAAVLNAVLQLPQLEALSITQAPDIWTVCSPLETVSHGTAEDIRQVAAVDTAFPMGLLPSVSAAAAAFDTLDDCGCWLLQHHPSLADLHIHTTDPGMGMSWQRQPDMQCQQEAANDDNTVSCSMLNVGIQEAAAAPTAADVLDVSVDCAVEARVLHARSSCAETAAAGYEFGKAPLLLGT